LQLRPNINVENYFSFKECLEIHFCGRNCYQALILQALTYVFGFSLMFFHKTGLSVTVGVTCKGTISAKRISAKYRSEFATLSPVTVTAAG
jgi:hypothetical protein